MLRKMFWLKFGADSTFWISWACCYRGHPPNAALCSPPQPQHFSSVPSWYFPYSPPHLEHHLFPHKQQQCVLCADNNNTKVGVHIPIPWNLWNITSPLKVDYCLQNVSTQNNFQPPNNFPFISSIDIGLHFRYITPHFFRIIKWLLEPLLFVHITLKTLPLPR